MFISQRQAIIHLENEKINGLKPHDVSKIGISRTFQNIRLFSEMSVLENVLVGMHTHLKAGLIGNFVKSSCYSEGREGVRNECIRLLEYVGLAHFLNEKACNLSYGAQRRLEIARALAAKPKVLLLDEPAAGMNPKETRELTQLITEHGRRIQSNRYINRA